MPVIMIGVGEFGASNSSGDTVKTMALGSCVAVMLLHRRTKSVGMVHVALPESKISPERAKERPGYFADTGIPSLLKKMINLGCGKNGREYIVKLAGGAQVMDPKGTFNIGKRNVLAVKKILWRYGMGAVAEDVGGSLSRTVTMEVNTGRVILSSAGLDNWEL